MIASIQPDVEWIAAEILDVSLDQLVARRIVGFGQQPADMCPEETGKRSVRVFFPIGILMMPAMRRDPIRRRILHRTHPHHGEGMFQPERAGEAAMGQQAVITNVDAEHAEDVDAEQVKDHAAPAEKPRQQRQRCDQVNDNKSNKIGSPQTH